MPLKQHAHGIACGRDTYPGNQGIADEEFHLRCDRDQARGMENHPEAGESSQRGWSDRVEQVVKHNDGACKQEKHRRAGSLQGSIFRCDVNTLW